MFENMSVSDLKTYLHERGVSVNGYLEPTLIEIANAVEKMMLPVVEKGSANFLQTPQFVVFRFDLSQGTEHREIQLHIA